MIEIDVIFMVLRKLASIFKPKITLNMHNLLEPIVQNHLLAGSPVPDAVTRENFVAPGLPKGYGQTVGLENPFLLGNQKRRLLFPLLLLLLLFRVELVGHQPDFFDEMITK